MGHIGQVAVVGSMSMDTTVVVDRFPGPGETLLASELRKGPGGKGGNQAVAAARAGGAQVRMIGSVGDDPDGGALLGAMASDGVDTQWIKQTDQPTGDAAAENQIVVAAGSNSLVSLADASALAGVGVVLGQLEIPQASLAAAVRLRPEGCWFVLNAAPAAEVCDELAREIDLLVVNEHEAKVVAGRDTVDAALEVLLARFPRVLVTLGARGSRYLADGQDLFTPAREVPVVDTVAAGDSFVGVFAAGVARGDALEVALEEATVAAGLTVGREGAQPAIPTRDEVLAAR